MKMNDQKPTWEEVYQDWKTLGMYSVLEVLKQPLTAEELHVEYDHQGLCIYGYDWLSKSEYEERKKILEKNVAQFLYLTEPTNKGTIHTLQMLMEAESEEERAAIWIYAFCRDLSNLKYHSETVRTADRLSEAVWPFLSERFGMWHHAMKRLTPGFFFTSPILRETEITAVPALLQLIRANAALVSYEYVPVFYSSLKPGEKPADVSIRLDRL